MKHKDFDSLLIDVAELFKVLGDSTRIRILYLLLKEKEKNVTEIADALNMNHSAISHQLRFLKNAKLIKNRREGKQLYYSLSDDHVSCILDMGIEHVEEI